MRKEYQEILAEIRKLKEKREQKGLYISDVISINYEIENLKLQLKELERQFLKKD